MHAPPQLLGEWAAFVVYVVGALSAFAGAMHIGWKYAIRPELHRQVKEVMSELKPNGGGSLRDAVDRLEAALCDHLEVADADHVDFREHMDDHS